MTMVAVTELHLEYLLQKISVSRYNGYDLSEEMLSKSKRAPERL